MKIKPTLQLVLVENKLNIKPVFELNSLENKMQLESESSSRK